MRKKKLFKIKMLRAQLRETEKDAKLKCEALYQAARSHQDRAQVLQARLNSIGASSVHIEPPGDVIAFLVRFDRRQLRGIKDHGSLLAGMAYDLFTKAAHELPELSVSVPKELIANLKTLPRRERKERLYQLFKAITRQVFDDLEKASRSSVGNLPFCPDPDAHELYETFKHGLSFQSFCKLIEMIENNADKIK